VFARGNQLGGRALRPRTRAPESQGGSCVRRGSKARNSGASESELRDKIWTRSHADASHQASKMLALAGNNGEQESATFGLQPRRTKEAAPSLIADGADGNWLRGQDLNLRPSGYEGGSTQPADGRRPSCFQSSRVVDSSAESTKVHAGIRGSLPVWTRSGQSFGEPLRIGDRRLGNEPFRYARTFRMFPESARPCDFIRICRHHGKAQPVCRFSRGRDPLVRFFSRAFPPPG